MTVVFYCIHSIQNTDRTPVDHIARSVIGAAGYVIIMSYSGLYVMAFWKVLY